MTDTPATAPGSARILCRGHPNIRASHGKTLEFTEDESVTTRGTCILGVGAEYDPAVLATLRGRVRVTLTSGDLSDSLTATICPLFHAGQPLILRRALTPSGRTFATAASKSSAEIDRELVEALRQEGAVLEVRIEQIAQDEDVQGGPNQEGAHQGTYRGALFVVGLPIGNMLDLSPRAIDVLASVDAVYAEDTRSARETLRWLGLSTAVVSCHEHNERARIGEILGRLAEGARLALVSEAGMPGVSDPGFPVVRAAVEAGAAVTAVPGPSAVLAALAVSGLASDAFAFFGFPPRQGSKRRQRLEELAAWPATLVLFESPHRLADTLEEAARAFAGRRMALCKDLTKQSETVLRGPVEEVRDAAKALKAGVGEFTLVIEGASPAETDVDDDAEIRLEPLLRALVAEGLPTKALSHALAKATGVSRRDAFARLVALKEEEAGQP